MGQVVHSQGGLARRISWSIVQDGSGHGPGKSGWVGSPWCEGQVQGAGLVR